MASKLNYDCLRYIFEQFEYSYDQDTLFKCLLVNRLWCQSAVLYLWKDPFSIVRRQKENSRKLLTTIISMFPFSKSVEDELTSLKYKLNYHGYKKSMYNYLSFCRVFRSTEFHGFIDKCVHAVFSSQSIRRVSSILLLGVYEIIFENCTSIRQIKLLTLPKTIVTCQAFNGLSNLSELEICNLDVVRFFGKLAQVCEKIKKIRITTRSFKNSQELINLFKAQKNLKSVHLHNDSSLCQIISEELSTQIHSIETLVMKNFIFKHVSNFPQLRSLEFSFSTCSPQVITAIQEVSCPLLEVLKFYRDFPPLNVLAEFVKKTEGHLRWFHLGSYSVHPISPYITGELFPVYQNFDTRVLLTSIAKSCPKIKSLATIVNITEDLSYLNHLLLSCDELESLTLTNVEKIKCHDGEMISQSLEERFRLLRINENWNVKYDIMLGCRFLVEKT